MAIRGSYRNVSLWQDQQVISGLGSHLTDDTQDPLASGVSTCCCEEKNQYIKISIKTDSYREWRVQEAHKVQNLVGVFQWEMN